MKHIFYVFYDSENKLFIKKYNYTYKSVDSSLPIDEKREQYRSKLYKQMFTTHLGQARVFYSPLVAKNAIDLKYLRQMFGNSINMKVIELSVEVE